MGQLQKSGGLENQTNQGAFTKFFGAKPCQLFTLEKNVCDVLTWEQTHGGLSAFLDMDLELCK